MFEVSITNISGITDINETELIWLPNNEYLRYWPNYLCVYAQYIDSSV